jgi:hypothetical protein
MLTMIPIPTRLLARGCALFLAVAAPCQGGEPAQGEPNAPAAAAPAPIPDGAPPGMAAIARSELLAHAAELSSDAYQGRLTGTEGQMKAAQYVADRFAELGLEPLGDGQAGKKRGWFQRYPIRHALLDPKHATLQVEQETFDRGFAVLFGRHKAAEARGPIVFLGRAVGSDELEGKSLAGKVALVCPKTVSGAKLGVGGDFGAGMSAMTRWQGLANGAHRAGARLLIIGLVDDEAAVTTMLNAIAVAPDKPVVSPRGDLDNMVGDGMASMMGGSFKVPIVVTASRVTNALLEAAGYDSAAVRAHALEDKERPEPLAGMKGQATVDLRLVERDLEAVNVVGVMRGADRKMKDEAIVYSAHLDHVGMRVDGDAFNGADDNASGTSGLLGIAKAFTSQPAPARSVVFLAVSGEELGLWGSTWFVAKPTWPLARMVANINTDMIGRGGPGAPLGEVMLTPSHEHKEYSGMARAAARLAGELGLTPVSGDEFYARSDHINFVKRGVPAVFLCCGGEHEDYHQATDHADKLDGEQMEKTARLAFWVGWLAAQGEVDAKTIGRRPGWLIEKAQ